MVGESKLDMSLDDLIKNARNKKPAGKPIKSKPGQQKQQGKAGPAQQKGGPKGRAPQQQQQQQKKGAQLKAKGGVAKPGAGARPGVGKPAQRPGQQRPKGQPDVRVVPRPGRPGAGRSGMQRVGMQRAGMQRAGMAPRGMGRPRPAMMQAPYVSPMGMGMGMQGPMGMGMPAPMMAQQMAPQQMAPPLAPAQNVAPPQQGKWQNDLFDGSVVTSSTSAKLLISNLDYKVTDEDIQELFGTVGTIKDSAIHYDKSGRSMGTASVVFEKRADALAAFNRYNNVALDNKKMSIEVVETAVPKGTFKTLSSGINVSRQQPGGGGSGVRGRGMPHSVAVPSGDYMQE